MEERNIVHKAQSCLCIYEYHGRPTYKIKEYTNRFVARGDVINLMKEWMVVCGFILDTFIAKYNHVYLSNGVVYVYASPQEENGHVMFEEIEECIYISLYVCYNNTGTHICMDILVNGYNQHFSSNMTRPTWGLTKGTKASFICGFWSTFRSENNALPGPLYQKHWSPPAIKPDQCLPCFLTETKIRQICSPWVCSDQSLLFFPLIITEHCSTDTAYFSGVIDLCFAIIWWRQWANP